MTINLKTNHDAEPCTSDVKKAKNHHKQLNFKDWANNMLLDNEDTQQSMSKQPECNSCGKIS